MSNYKDTVFLPRTSLPVKAKLEAENTILAGWGNLYRDLRASRDGAIPWVLHDGPPYANGDIHIGHALNKILKDTLVRGHNMLGFDAPFVPGWDCHGLPIEWKVEEEWRKAKRDKNADPVGFRADCRAFAAKWVETQKGQFKRLGILADWDATNHPVGTGPYLTMTPEAESTIVYLFHEMVRHGLVYRANKPVLWSPAERTALAEAEVNETEHMVPNVWVRFVVLTGPLNDDQASLLVWTTTPWSLPGNVAVAYNPDIPYGLYEAPSGRYVVADSLVEQALAGENYTRVRDVTENDFLMPGGNQGRACYNPLGEGYELSRIIPASFVRDNSGTGFVHVGPAHATEDWIAWRNYKGPDAKFPNPVMENGVYAADVPVFAGVAVTKGKKFGPANEMIVDHLLAQGALYHREDRPLTVQHSWRSDAVLITRAAPQVFISMDRDGLSPNTARHDALDELNNYVKFTPPHAKQRMVGMLRDRPDWLVSRQRLWGTPLALFVHRETGEILNDPAVLGAAHQMIADAGAESWYETSVEDFFKAIQRNDWADYERIDDVLDVWFDSGCVHYLMGGKADLVVEGTDQSRGWFQASLLTAVLTGRTAPYHQVLTHGFTLDATGKKMSKSEGNVIDPLKVIATHGADTLRVWVASSDVTEDIRISTAAMDSHAETARKVRNTLRYIVGALDGYEADAPAELPELERYILHRVEEISDRLKAMLRANDLTQYMATIVKFCVHDLSTMWFDVRKDTLYCDALGSQKRRAYLWTLDRVFEHMVRWIAPVMVFAAEELWQARHPGESVHLQLWETSTESHRDADLAERWGRILGYRSAMLAALEGKRAVGEIKSSTEADLTVMVKLDSQAHNDLQNVDLAELAIVGNAVLVAFDLYPFNGPVEVSVDTAETPRCDRCWLSKTDVHDCGDGHLCDRCCEVVQ